MSQPVESASPKQSRASRRAARLAAVQALYDMEISGHVALQALDGFRARGGTADLDGETIPADEKFFTELLKGVTTERNDLDRLIGEALQKGRQVGNLETVLRSILRCGAYEMARRDDIDAAVVINEYVTVAAAYYDAGETSFVNGVLDRLGRVLRENDD